MVQGPDSQALLLNLARCATAMREAGTKVNSPSPIAEIAEADYERYMEALGELEEAIFNHLAFMCYLAEEIPELYEEAVKRLRRLSLATTA